MDGDFRMNVLEINILALAYLGDAVYELYIRRHLLDQKINHVNDLQTASLAYVSAKRQAFFLEKLEEASFFTEEEMDIIHRARNYKSNRHPKNCSILTYKHATALEAVVGYWSYLHKDERIDEMMEKIVGGSLC